MTPDIKLDLLLNVFPVIVWSTFVIMGNMYSCFSEVTNDPRLKSKFNFASIIFNSFSIVSMVIAFIKWINIG